MAKESASSRIPRLDGVSRIPLPGSIRPPKHSIQPTQILRPPATTCSGFKAPTINNAVIRKSSSGDRINNVVNLMSRKTNTAFKKFFSKPERVALQSDNVTVKLKNADTKDIKDVANANESHAALDNTPPATLTRSDTFISGASPLSGLNITQDILAQSTPVPSTIKRTACETTHLIGKNSRSTLYTTRTLDVTSKKPPLLSETITYDHKSPSQHVEVDVQYARTKQILGNTVHIEDSPMQRHLNCTQTVNAVNLTSTLSGPQVFGKTMCVDSPIEQLKQQMLVTKNLNSDFTQTLSFEPKVLDNTDIASPVTNATYSNPGSTDNLLMLEDVSIPSDLDLDVTLQNEKSSDSIMDKSIEQLHETVQLLAPDKAKMNLPLNSTINTERLIDITTNVSSPEQQLQLFNVTGEHSNLPEYNNSQLLYMTQLSSSAITTPEQYTKFGNVGKRSTLPTHMLTPMLLKGARSDILLPTRTPDDDACEPMDVDTTLSAMGASTEDFYVQQKETNASVMSLQDVEGMHMKPKSRYSFGLDLTESTLDCSIELVDVSLSSTALSQQNITANISENNMSQSASSQQLQQQLLKKQSSFELDESLGILTPDQMKEFLDSATTNTNNLELPLHMNNKLAIHQMRIDQTPSPEELPLDPVEVKTDTTDLLLSQHQQQTDLTYGAGQQRLHMQQQQQLQTSSMSTEPVSLHTDTEPSKTDQLIKSTVSKISTSFITSVTSVTSLDTGYQGDGEMSRPASRGAGDHSPSNATAARKGGHVSRQPSFNQQQANLPPIRRQDPMTDSDFFTESDADDIFHRGDRRAQVIDGQLYGPMLQPAASVFISEDPQMEDSCMESSGIFTDIENRCDEDLAQMRRQDTQEPVDMSPDGDIEADDSTETVQSNRECIGKRSRVASHNGDSVDTPPTALGQGQLCGSQTSSTIQSSLSNDRLSAATLSNRTSYCSVDGSAVNVDGKSFSSLEEAFGECASTGDEQSAASTNTNARHRVKSSNTGSLSCCEAQQYQKSSQQSKQQQPQPQRSLNSGAAIQSVQSVQSVQRVTSPRKHASLSSLCNVSGVAGVFGAKTETVTGTGTGTGASTPVYATRVHSIESASRSVSGNGSKTSLNESVKSTSTASGRSACVNQSVCAVAGKNSPRAKTIAKNVKSNVTTTGAGTSAGTSTDSGTRTVTEIGNQNNCNSSTAIVRKTPVPNKWAAVMNSIANNKALIKRNYNDVKSKLSTRMTMGTRTAVSASSTPIVRRSPTGVRSVTKPTLSSAQRSNKPIAVSSTSSPKAQQTDTINTNGLQSPQAKRLLQAAVKRGRSYSKDSQKSSQSDLSLASGGSPKQLAKTPLRAAKKRDVRNLSISPTDLGPPPKTQQTANGTTTRSKAAATTTTTSASTALTQKRFSSNASATHSAASTTASTPTGSANVSISGTVGNSGGGSGNGSFKGSPPAKKHSVTNRRVEVKTLTKSPLKDHNRIIGSPQTNAASVVAKIGNKPEAPTELHEINNQNHNISHLNNNNHGTSIEKLPTAAPAAATTTTTTTNLRTSSQTPSPILGVQHTGKKVTTVAAAAVLLEKKSPRKLLFQKQQQPRSTEQAPITPTVEYLDAAELQQLKLLNRHSCNGRLNYESIERHLQQAELQRQQADKGVEALGVLLQYLVYDLDAFACPTAKKESLKAKDSLSKTLRVLEEAKSTCTELQDQLCEKEAYYVQREEELQALHRCEMERAQKSLCDLQILTQNEKTALETELVAQDAEHKRVFDAYRLEMEHKLTQKVQHLTELEIRERALQERVNAVEQSEQQLHDRLAADEKSHIEHLQLASERENQLNEQIKLLSKELNTLRASKEDRERELREKLNLSQDEIAVLRSSQRSLNESGEQRGMSPRNTSSTSELSRLKSEAESLHCVLELKQKEISKLTKHNEELLRDADERAALQAKISVLESRNEMLQSELEIKSEKEKDFQRQIDDIQKAFNHETVKRTRLTYDNEALQWQLKQRSEQLHIVEAKLQELSAQESLLNATSNTTTNQCSSLGSSSRSSQLNGTSLTAIQVPEEGSPPASPIIKGVIEKNDSVSWVLEMDDETPEVAASKMVKRAGSFRSVERSPSTRRQLSVSANATLSTAQAMTSNGTGPNPLSQSMSATSVIRPHSSEAGGIEFVNRSHSRIRSKSVSVKGTDPAIAVTVNSSSSNTNTTGGRGNKKLTRQHSVGNNSRRNELTATAWKEQPICASSPYYGVRPRTSTMKFGGTTESETVSGDAPLFRRSMAAGSAQKLITCDTSALNSGERLEMRSLPSHPSVHDLKTRKKCQEIQESAGEAMVSGTNSEDEGCSASSDEVVSSASTTSGTSGSTSSLHQMKNAQMSLEEVLLLDKINSLNGTPMEVSWSDDADLFANGSAV